MRYVVDIHGDIEGDYDIVCKLPKGHGDLIDKSKLEVCPIDITDLPTDKCLMVYLAEDVENAKVIIKADKEAADKWECKRC